METQDNRRPGGCSESGGARAIPRPHWIAVPTSQRLSFRALRNGSAFGTHDLTFSPEGASLKVETNIEYAFKVGFVTLFRYKLRGLESWVGNVLTAAQAKTDNNGAWAFMTAERTKDGLIVDGSQTGRYRAPDGALIASHWNIAQTRCTYDKSTGWHLVAIHRGVARFNENSRYDWKPSCGKAFRA